jgi:hypothetical protein
MDKYFVVFHKHEWIVKHGPAGYGTYPSRAAAIVAAIEQANRSTQEGATVVVQGEGEAFFRTEWSSVPDSPVIPQR